MLRAQQLLTLPYGDLDVAGAADHDPALIALAGTQVSTTLDAWGLTGTSGGRLAERLPRRRRRSTRRTGTRRARHRPDVRRLTPPASRRSTDARWSSPPSGAASGGPGTGRPARPGWRSRQRILSEAALRVLEPGRRDPLVVVLPAELASQAAERVLRRASTSTGSTSPPSPPRPQRDGTRGRPDDLVYPERQDRLELDAGRRSRPPSGLIAAGETLQNLLTRNDEVGAEVADEALTGASYTSRRRPQTLPAPAATGRAAGSRSGCSSVRIDAPPGSSCPARSGGSPRPSPTGSTSR